MFKADEAVEKLEYDFSPYGPRGCSPEPSDRAIEKFRQQFFRLAQGITDQVMLQTEESKPENAPMRLDEALRVIGSLDGTNEFQQKVDGQLTEMISTLLQNDPPRQVLEQLPGRIRTAYYGWVVGQMLNPKSLTNATKPFLRAV